MCIHDRLWRVGSYIIGWAFCTRSCEVVHRMKGKIGSRGEDNKMFGGDVCLVVHHRCWFTLTYRVIQMDIVGPMGPPGIHWMNPYSESIIAENVGDLKNDWDQVCLATLLRWWFPEHPAYWQMFEYNSRRMLLDKIERHKLSWRKPPLKNNHAFVQIRQASTTHSSGETLLVHRSQWLFPHVSTEHPPIPRLWWML